MSTGIGERMKAQYEDRCRYLLPRRTYTIVRVDGRAFHTYTKGCDRPFDLGLHDAMCQVGIMLCQDAQGAKFGFVQSDECSVVMTDFDSITTEAWFDGNIQKIASISASIATVAFNRVGIYGRGPQAQFDARVFTIPDYTEVENYFIWRQQDATRNSISMAAQSIFSHKQLLGKNIFEMHDMLHKEGINWNDYPTWFKRGTGIVRETYTVDVQSIGPEMPVEKVAIRHEWIAHEDVPIFTANRNYLRSRFYVEP